MFNFMKGDTMGWDCMIKGMELDNVRTDRRASKSVEKYNISEQAIYFDNKYLPLSAIQRMRMQPSMYTPQGCCGKGIPVTKIRLEYGGEKPAVLMLEKESNAIKTIQMIKSYNDNAQIEEYIDPITGQVPEKWKGIFG